MVIEIENTSSPGASFTKNTNGVLLKTYEWICEHKGLVLPFRDFRMKLQNEKGINDNNNRNIYPLLKNGGLVSYEKGADLHVDVFFTNKGLAYVKTLKTIDLIQSEEGYTAEQKKKAIQKMEIIQNEIIYGAIERLLQQPGVNYAEPLRDLVGFLLEYRKINKYEFAYLLYVRQKQEISKALESMHENIKLYRSGNLDIDVRVRVRNDISIREQTQKENRNEGLTFLTSYGYFIGLLMQAGLVRKEEDYFYVVAEKTHLLERLGGK